MGGTWHLPGDGSEKEDYVIMKCNLPLCSMTKKPGNDVGKPVGFKCPLRSLCLPGGLKEFGGPEGPRNVPAQMQKEFSVIALNIAACL